MLTLTLRSNAVLVLTAAVGLAISVSLTACAGNDTVSRGTQDTSSTYIGTVTNNSSGTAEATAAQGIKALEAGDRGKLTGLLKPGDDLPDGWTHDQQSVVGCDPDTARTITEYRPDWTPETYLVSFAFSQPCGEDYPGAMRTRCAVLVDQVESRWYLHGWIVNGLCFGPGN
jgi:hypothetical protein